MHHMHALKREAVQLSIGNWCLVVYIGEEKSRTWILQRRYDGNRIASSTPPKTKQTNKQYASLSAVHVQQIVDVTMYRNIH